MFLSNLVVCCLHSYSPRSIVLQSAPVVTQEISLSAAVVSFSQLRNGGFRGPQSECVRCRSLYRASCAFGLTLRVPLYILQHTFNKTTSLAVKPS
jgi:hypothetical protein